MSLGPGASESPEQAAVFSDPDATRPRALSGAPNHGRSQVPVSSLTLGELLANRYRIERLLGVGGMGEVYEAWDEELSIPVALKALRTERVRESRAIRSLKQEVLLARSVSHPGVCRVYDLGRHEAAGGDATWFLTMELLRGETLAEHLRRRGRLPASEALPLVEQMVDGLGAAHRAGVLHLDFKSGNVMLVKNGDNGNRVVVTDFGIARAAAPPTARHADGNRSEQTEFAGGTPAYMSPEQVRGESAGPAADIYALGVVIYEMVTGTLPFSGTTPLEVASRRLREEPPSPRTIVSEVDETWEKTILRCLARDPRGRFQRVEEVVDLLIGRGSLATVSTSDLVKRAPYALPAERDAFVGRETELDALDRRLGGGSRLVTILGAAGMGKTRLAVRYGRRSLETWPGGVWFCDLTEAESLNGIASAVASALDVTLGKGDPIEQLGHAIAGRGRCLVVLDNFEQVAGHAGETVGRWLGRAHEARFVVTSRERLKMRGEEVQAVEPLGVEAAVELFVARAAQQRPGFKLVESEIESVRQVVRLVEGMPLAIELAAARVSVMTPSALVGRMHEQLRVLGGGVESRHRSLRVAIDGSWELLEPWERAAWAQCAVFEGGFTLEAGEAVVDVRAWPEAPWVVDVMQSLVDKSLLRVWMPEGKTSGAAEARFGMYASLQEYAREQLRGLGAGQECAAEERHGRWYARYGTEESIELDRHGGVELLGRLEQEIDNLIAACTRAVRREDPETAAASYVATERVLELRSPLGAAVDLGGEVLAMPLAPLGRARVLHALGQAERISGRTEDARVHNEAALSIHRELGDRRGEGTVLGAMGTVHREQGRMEEARSCYEAALSIHRELGSRRGEGSVLTNLGILHWKQGRNEEARECYEAALSIHREMGHRRTEGGVLGALGILHWNQGRIKQAFGYYEAALSIHREIGDRREESSVLCNLGILHWEQGRTEDARDYYEAALSICRDLGKRSTEGDVLANLGILHQVQGQLEEARSCYEAALSIHRELGHQRSVGVHLGNLGELHHCQDRPEEARECYEAALSIHREVGNRLCEAVALGALGSLHREHGRIEEARVALAEGEAIAREVGDPTELGKLLCARAEFEFANCAMDAARSKLREAETLAAQVEAGSDSELGRKLAKVRRTLAGNA